MTNPTDTPDLFRLQRRRTDAELAHVDTDLAPPRMPWLPLALILGPLLWCVIVVAVVVVRHG